MQRRDFSKQLATAGLGLAVAGVARAQGGPVEGTDFVKLSSPVPVSLAGDKKVEVLEFFSYGCPHCHNLEPLLQSWVKKLPADVSFRQVPVGFSVPYQVLQKLYYALEEIGQLPNMHGKVFAAIHQQRMALFTDKDVLAYVKASGLDVDKFSAAYKSFGVATKCTRAKQSSEAYKIDGVPAIGIQGRYYTAASLAGSHERALAVADVLIARSRQKT